MLVETMFVIKSVPPINKSFYAPERRRVAHRIRSGEIASACHAIRLHFLVASRDLLVTLLFERRKLYVPFVVLQLGTDTLPYVLIACVLCARARGRDFHMRSRRAASDAETFKTSCQMMGHPLQNTLASLTCWMTTKLPTGLHGARKWRT